MGLALNALQAASSVQVQAGVQAALQGLSMILLMGVANALMVGILIV